MALAEWAIGAAITLFGFYLTNSLRRQQRVRIAEKRFGSYCGLWATMHVARPTRLEPQENLGPITSDEAGELYVAMTNWYFEGGNGMLLTNDTKEMYLLAKRRLGEYAISSDDDREAGVRRMHELSLLRSQMKRDLDIYGVFYFDNLDAEDVAFLSDAGVGVSAWRQSRLNRRRWTRGPRKRQRRPEGARLDAVG